MASCQQRLGRHLGGQVVAALTGYRHLHIERRIRRQLGRRRDPELRSIAITLGQGLGDGRYADLGAGCSFIIYDDDEGGIAWRLGQAVAVRGDQGGGHGARRLVNLVVLQGEADQAAAVSQCHLARQRPCDIVALLRQGDRHGQAAAWRRRQRLDQELHRYAVCLGHLDHNRRYADHWVACGGQVVVHNGDCDGAAGCRGYAVSAHSLPWLQSDRHSAVWLVNCVVVYGDAQQAAAVNQRRPARRWRGQVVAGNSHRQLHGQFTCQGRHCGERELRHGAFCLGHHAGNAGYADFRQGVVIHDGNGGGIVRRLGNGKAKGAAAGDGHGDGAVSLLGRVIGYGDANEALQAGHLYGDGQGPVYVAAHLGHLHRYEAAARSRREQGDLEHRHGAMPLGHCGLNRLYAERRRGAGAGLDGDGGGMVRRLGQGVALPCHQGHRHGAVALPAAPALYGDAQGGAAVGQGCLGGQGRLGEAAGLGCRQVHGEGAGGCWCGHDGEQRLGVVMLVDHIRERHYAHHRGWRNCRRHVVIHDGDRGAVVRRSGWQVFSAGLSGEQVHCDGGVLLDFVIVDDGQAEEALGATELQAGSVLFLAGIQGAADRQVAGVKVRAILVAEYLQVHIQLTRRQRQGRLGHDDELGNDAVPLRHCGKGGRYAQYGLEAVIVHDGDGDGGGGVLGNGIAVARRQGSRHKAVQLVHIVIRDVDLQHASAIRQGHLLRAADRDKAALFHQAQVHRQLPGQGWRCGKHKQRRCVRRLGHRAWGCRKADFRHCHSCIIVQQGEADGSGLARGKAVGVAALMRQQDGRHGGVWLVIHVVDDGYVQQAGGAEHIDCPLEANLALAVDAIARLARRHEAFPADSHLQAHLQGSCLHRGHIDNELRQGIV